MNKEHQIEILEKPEWVSWDEIHNVLWRAHEQNRQNGIKMAFPALPGDKIREKVEGHGKMLVAMDGQKVVGTAAIIIKKVNIWCGKGEYAYCCFASVLPEYSGMGIYKSLNINREENALRMGLKRMMFDTHEHNKRKIEGDYKAGFKLVDISVWKDHYNVVMVKWLNGCPYPNWYCKMQFYIHKWYKKFRFKPGRVKRFGI